MTRNQINQQNFDRKHERTQGDTAAINNFGENSHSITVQTSYTHFNTIKMRCHVLAAFLGGGGKYI